MTFKNIVVGDDFSTGGEVAYRAAAALARRCGAELRIVHIVERHAPAGAATRTDSDVASKKMRERLAASAANEEYGPISADCIVLEGEPSEELLRAANRWNTDLLVIGGMTSQDKPALGKVAEAVVQQSRGPVLVAKRPLDADSRRFLAPVDFSSTARSAAERAVSLARCFGAQVRFFHSLILSDFFAAGPAAETGTRDTELLTQPEPLEKQWQAFLAALPDLDKISWEKHTEQGLAATLIVQEAMKNESDLIIMGTHGRSGSSAALIGSVTAEVLRHASCSVLTLRPGG